MDAIQEEEARDIIWGGWSEERVAGVEIKNGSDGRDVSQAGSTLAEKIIVTKFGFYVMIQLFL